MKLLEDTNEFEIDHKRGIFRAFDIKQIIKDMRSYGVKIEALPEKQFNDYYRCVMLVAPYTGNYSASRPYIHDAQVALFVDEAAHGARAIARGGCDKQTIMLLSSIANKHIREPYTYDNQIRSKI